MKMLSQHIIERLQLNKDRVQQFECVPKTTEELQKYINQKILKEGPECNLNNIDVSNITDMSYLFAYSKFNGDISQWNVSNVKNMTLMFYHSTFNKDISKWDVSNVEDMHNMFDHSEFNQDISRWNVNNNTDTISMFYNTPLAGKEKKWWHK